VPSVELAARLAKALGVLVDDLLSPGAVPKTPRAKTSEARLLALVRGMDDGQIDDIAKGIKLIMAAARRDGPR
jgi:hypothetical protein